MPHYHVHVLISAGALSKSSESWQKSQKEYLFPAHALSKVFRAIFKKRAAQSFKNTGQILPSSPKKWNVYCKAPYQNVQTCIKYFALYCNRVAISDRRIRHIDAEKQEVSIAYKRKEKMSLKDHFTLSFKDFLSRFATHILPKGFAKIRYCGLYSNRGSKDYKKRALELINNSKALKSVGSSIDKAPSSKNLCPKCSHILKYSVTLHSRTSIEALKATGPPLSTNKATQLSNTYQAPRG